MPPVPPPQSTSVSAPFFRPSLQSSIPPHRLGTIPHVAACATQLVGVHPQTLGVPPPPQVEGDLHWASVMQVHCPIASHVVLIPHAVPCGLPACDGTPPLHTSIVQSFPSS